MVITVKKLDMSTFQQMVRGYYTDSGRHDMPWRQPAFDPYRIMVSEMMLQQTQVTRVTVKYAEFLPLFPSVTALAAAPLADVLSAWNGLGYNRRAKFLWQAAQLIVTDYDGVFPTTVEGLVKLPGIGPNTAGAIMAYAYNQPIIFIETNIRTVFIHHFFHDETGVSDSAVLTLVEQSLDRDNPREWYWALMDYGAYLKQTVGNSSRASKSYAKQSKFDGSLRQIRGQALRLLMEKPLAREELNTQISDQRLGRVLEDLQKENLIRLQGSRYHLG